MSQWRKPLLAVLAVLVAVAGIGFGIGYLSRPDDSGPDLTAEEAFSQAREEAMKQVSSEMARRGFVEGKRDGRSHGIIAGGMAAESAVTIKFRQERASAAQSEAAEAQSELAGMAAAPAPPTFTPDDG
ncbi:MAG: hypothetical protein J0H66_03850 [Solirubrobacterales bacterium]|nr:hypothetical protein [Solirubrobacterales bacterium]OJU96225.1 MAG: hypothetical protein BGO23_01515 [Solirubrobacterales bacterium 67-14]